MIKQDGSREKSLITWSAGCCTQGPALVNRHQEYKSPDFSSSHFPNLLKEWHGPVISKFPSAPIIPLGVSLWLLRTKTLNLPQWPFSAHRTRHHSQPCKQSWHLHSTFPTNGNFQRFLWSFPHPGDMLLPSSDQQLKLLILLGSQFKVSTKERMNYHWHWYKPPALTKSTVYFFFHMITSLKLCVPLLIFPEHFPCYVLHTRSTERFKAVLGVPLSFVVYDGENKAQ